MAAVQVARNAMNVSNNNNPMKGKKGRYRCGKLGHFSRDCNLSFSDIPKAAAFAPLGKKGGGKAPNYKGKNTYYTDEISDEQSGEQFEHVGLEQPTLSESETGVDGMQATATGFPSPEVGFTDTEDVWMTQWWGEGTFLVHDDPPLSSPSTTICIARPLALIDSGATNNVVGEKWLSLWSGVD